MVNVLSDIYAYVYNVTYNESEDSFAFFFEVSIPCSSKENVI